MIARSRFRQADVGGTIGGELRPDQDELDPIGTKATCRERRACRIHPTASTIVVDHDRHDTRTKRCSHARGPLSGSRPARSMSGSGDCPKAKNYPAHHYSGAVTRHWPPAAGEQATPEFEGGIDPARRVAHDWITLGDGSPLDLLAVREHIVGLEAELFEARAEVTDLRNELSLLKNRRVVRLVDLAGGRAVPVLRRFLR